MSEAIEGTEPATPSEEAAPESPSRPTPHAGHPFLLYALARVALLVGTGAILMAFNIRGLLMIVLAFLISGLISFFVLDRFRDQMGMRIGGYFSRMNSRIDENTNSEDQLIEDARRQHDEDQASAESTAVDPKPADADSIDLTDTKPATSRND